MSFHSLPISLSALTEREAVADALFRLFLSFDNNDASMLDSAYTSNGIFNLNGKTFQGIDAIRSHLSAPIATLDTMHQASNIRIEVKEGYGTATLTAYVISHHSPKGRGTEPNGPKFTGGSNYCLNLVKDTKEGLWKIEKLVLKVVWTMGDPSFMPKPE